MPGLSLKKAQTRADRPSPTPWSPPVSLGREENSPPRAPSILIVNGLMVKRRIGDRRGAGEEDAQTSDWNLQAELDRDKG